MAIGVALWATPPPPPPPFLYMIGSCLYAASHILYHSFAHADEISTLSAVAAQRVQQHPAQVTGHALPVDNAVHTQPSRHQAPQLAVQTTSSGGATWLTWTDVGVCISGVCAAGYLAHSLRAGIVLTVVNVAIIVSVIKVFKARSSDAAKSSLSDI